MSYAVLFKIYFVDPFVIRQLERLKARLGEGHLYIIADETGGNVGEIPHDRVIRTTEAEMIERGFAKSEPDSALFWHAADYSLIRLFEEQPAYDYYVTVEYDAIINAELGSLIASIAAGGADFVGKSINTKILEWWWWYTCEEVYDADIVHPYLNAIAFFSARSIPLLRERRLQQSQQFRDKQIEHMPLSEAFIPTELLRSGFTVANLADFGSIEFYDWWPPTNETELEKTTKSTFVHPVLEGSRYVASLLRGSQPSVLFGQYGGLREKFSALDPGDYLVELFLHLDRLNQARSQNIPVERLQSALFEMPDPGPNRALHKPANQSSISAMSRNQDTKLDAAGAVNGLVTGTFGFHTNADDPPWWQVDLKQVYMLDEIWVYNCLDLDNSNQHLNIFISENRRMWNQVLVRTPLEFGGAFGGPLILKFPERTIARFIQLELSEKGHLHLDQVKVFGQPIDEVLPQAS